MADFKSDVRDGLRIDWDVPIEMDDGVVLRCDVFRPVKSGKYPVIMTYGPYAKWLHFEDRFDEQWKRMVEKFPEVATDTSSHYQNWEVVDPEKWVPDGYVCIRVDSRGAGRSPGLLDVWSARERSDFAACIEWAGKQKWSNGKVGLNGISYYAMNAWQVAGVRPKHLAAVCIWEGAGDFYREAAYHGGIFSTFASTWYVRQVMTVQHGLGERSNRSRMTGEFVAGPDTLTEEELRANRRDLGADMLAAPLASDEFWTSRMPDYANIDVPVLSAANWGGQGLHPRGNFEGWLETGCKDKWLEVHGIEHWTHFYTDYGLDLQKRFFGYYLKGEKNGWKSKQPRVLLQVRHPGEKFVERAENEWPLKRTKWTKFYLDPENDALTAAKPKTESKSSYRALGDGLTYLTPALDKETEITGPIAAKLWVSSSTTDADLFLVLRVFSPDLTEVVFQGALDPHTPVAQGWLRASHRKLDRKKSLPYRPYHTHDEVQKLTPGDIYELDIEIWPTCIVVPKGYRVALTLRGKDYRWPGAEGAGVVQLQGRLFSGVGPFKHDDGRTRPLPEFDSDITLHSGPDMPAHVLLPVIPPKKK
ncbi:MAG: CocE/NonD family hydrolase [Alphaproteobacteria bacterium]